VIRAGELERAGARYGVPVYAADLPQHNTGIGRYLTDLAENSSDFNRAREAQRTGLESAATRLLDDTGVPMGDAAEVAQRQADEVLRGRKAEAGRLYDEVQRLSGEDFIETPGLIASVKRARTDLEDSLLPDHPLLTQLQEMEDRLIGSGDSGFQRLLTFGELRDLRSTLKSQLRDAKAGMGAMVGDRATRTVAQITDALQGDMDAFARGTDLEPAWNRANAFYRDEVAPLKDPRNRAVINALSDPITGDQKLESMLNSTRGATNQLERLVHALGGDVDALRSLFVGKAIRQATDAEGTFSPTKFGSYLSKHPGVTETLYGPGELDGLMLLTHALGSKIGSAVANPKTGARLMPMLGLGGGVGVGGALGSMAGGPLGAAVGGIAGTALFPVAATAASKLMTSRGGRDLLRSVGQGTTSVGDAIRALDAHLGVPAAIGTERALSPPPAESSVPMRTKLQGQAVHRAANLVAQLGGREAPLLLSGLAEQIAAGDPHAIVKARAWLNDARSTAAMRGHSSLAAELGTIIELV
jgi:hypothetical protein